MERQLSGKRPTFHREEQRGSSAFHILILLGMILAGVWVLRALQSGEAVSPFQSTPTPTRLPESYFMEAQAYFEAGKLDDPSNELIATTTPGAQAPAINDAIEAYKAALAGDPQNAHAWAELARIQAYSSNMLRNDTERLVRLEEARASADKAIELAPDDSTIRAIRAFVLDWYAFNPLVPQEQSLDLLVEAEREASRAFQLDPENALALAYYAEILADEQKWTQAEKYAAQAVSLNPDLMDTHRVYGYVLETLGKYNSAIQQYQEAARINPNLTFLYIRIGRNFREGIKNPDRALDYFDRAAKINQQLGIQNPTPYIEIARTYTQIGQFFAASINAEKALTLDPGNAQVYGQLGIIFRRARNYEGAMPLLKCAVRGCTVEENEMGQRDVQGLPLTSITVAYYYVEYGTNLAFLSRPNENYCPEALDVLQEVREAYPDDPTLMSIVEDSEGICRRLQGGSVPTPTIMPAATQTPGG
ncbi:MAG: tetratricopeptide repeat protein [Anaerolineales bacterium]|nr:tetratricopeptide repeat protein [Anaerolineales bacterium]